MQQISKHISFDEATKSVTAIRRGIYNVPTAEILLNMVKVAENCFEPLREWYGKPLKINSFYRCKALNTAVGGSSTSDHMQGMSIDIDAGSKEENLKLFNWLKDNVKYKQLIHEYGDKTGPDWVHVSYDENNLKQQVLYIK